MAEQESPNTLRHRATQSSSTGWNLEVPSLKHRHLGPHSPHSGEKTVAQLRQRFEQLSNQGAERYRGHRRSKPIRSTFVPVEPRKVKRSASDIKTTAESGYVLPQSTFDPASEQPAKQSYSFPVVEDGTQEHTLPLLQPTVYTGHHSINSELRDGPLHDGSSLILDKDMAMSQDWSDNGPYIPVESLAGPEDGVSIFDFAYLYAANTSSSPVSGQRHVRFTSRSNCAPPTYSKSSWDESARNSTIDLIDLGEYDETPSVVHRYQSHARNDVGSSNNSEEEELLLLPASVYVPQDIYPDSIVQKVVLTFSASQIISPGPADDMIEQKSEAASDVEMEDDKGPVGTKGESEEVLDLLPASVYTSPDLFISAIEENVDGIHMGGASIAEEHCGGALRSGGRTVRTLRPSERAHRSN